jgi:IS30 family transposase
MPAQRKLTMRRLRQLLRLNHEGVSARGIARTLGAARSTVQDALNRAKSAGLSWPLSSDLTDQGLEKRLFSPSGL